MDYLTRPVGADALFAPFYALPGTRTLANRIMDGKALVRKVVAMAHAAAHLPDDALLLWLDVDTALNRALDTGPFFPFVLGRDVSYIAAVASPKWKSRERSACGEGRAFSKRQLPGQIAIVPKSLVQ